MRERLLRLEEVVSRLERLGQRQLPDFGDDFRDAWAAERGLHLGAEIVFDVGNHILSAHFGVSADDYEDIVARLAEHGVLAPDLRERLKGLGGFRNILVHGYLRLDSERVAAYLTKAPADFSEFSRSVRAWLDATLK